MPSQVRSIRAPEADWKKWDAQAKSENMSRNNWIRRSLNDSCALSKAIEKAPKRVEDQAKAESLKSVMYPQERARCSHRLMPGTWCKKCGVTK